jgi:quinoprotein glucose dehydrogenase
MTITKTKALCTVALAIGLATPAGYRAQDRSNPKGEWRHQSGDAFGTRFAPLDQINATNFSKLEAAWTFRGDNFGPEPYPNSRSTPTYINGMLYSVAGQRRTVVAMDPKTGEVIWTYREPNTTRWQRSMRSGYGKGVAYAEIDGRGVIYLTSPGFFLHALDAKTGLPLENWGRPVPLPGFPKSGVVDLVEDLIQDWGPWQKWRSSGKKYDPDMGVPRELGYITSSSPPIVVNGVVVVGNSAEQGYNQTRIENVPGDILAYDARTGKHLWKFHVIPRPGEFGHDTWLNNAWSYTGDVSSWAPMSADAERGIVYIPTNPPTIDYFGGFRPGANLYGTSVIALDVKTGKRVWHFQTVHNDQWNYDLPNVPILANLTVSGKPVPALIQTTKQGFIFTFNRVTGQPVWPIEERPVPQTQVPGNWTSPTQPFPTKPEPMEPMGLVESDLIDFTPQLRQQALEIVKKFRVGGPYEPRLQFGHKTGVENNIRCTGGLNITNPATFDPTTNILYVSHSRNCSAGGLQPGKDVDKPDDPATTGTTISQWVNGPGGGMTGPQGLPIFKPPYNRLSAYDMNTGTRLWWIPIGETPANIRNHPALKGVNIGETGGGGNSIQMVTSSLLLATEGRSPILNAYNKETGKKVGSVKMPAGGQYGMMSYQHEGKQYIIVQISSGQYPGSLVALALPSGDKRPPQQPERP